MLIAGVSDLHGHLSHSIPECDVLAICGDIVPLYSAPGWRHDKQEMIWMKTKFVRWLKRQPFRKCFVVPGNHDFCMYNFDTREEVRDALQSIPNVTVLDQTYQHEAFEGKNFAGHPWTPRIGTLAWAYNTDRWESAHTNSINSGTDVLLSHGPPLGLLDGFGTSDKRVGCSQLMERILTIGPRLTMCGHIHEQRGNRLKFYDLMGNQCNIVNVSLCDKRYTVKGAKVQTFELF